MFIQDVERPERSAVISTMMREVWAEYKFNEDLTDLEDTELAKRLIHDGREIGYVASASIEHIHKEGWHLIRKRYEREAIALSKIDPALSIGYWESMCLICNAYIFDGLAAIQNNHTNALAEIMLYRYNQFLGSYEGSRLGRSLIKVTKNDYFHLNSQS